MRQRRSPHRNGGLRPLRFKFLLMWVLTISLVGCLGACTGRQPSFPEKTEALRRQIDGGVSQVGPNAFEAPATLRANPRGIKFETLSIEAGLSQSFVNALFQDSDGFLWFGTLDGLNRYDGYEFTIYQHDPEDPASISNNKIWAIVEDSQGALWVGTDHGLNRMDRGTGAFSAYFHESDNPASLSSSAVRVLYAGRDGSLWIGTSGGGLNRFDSAAGAFIRYENDPSDQASLSNNSVMSILEDQQGVLWVGTFGGGLNRLNSDGATFTHYKNSPRDPTSLVNNYVVSIFEDRGGELWFGTVGGGLERFNREKSDFEHFSISAEDPLSFYDHAVRTIYENRFGTFWIGTYGSGVQIFDRETGSFTRFVSEIGNPNSLSSNAVTTLMEDASGVLWIGTAGGGISKVDPSASRFVVYRHDPNNPVTISGNEVISIYEDRLGVLWVGTAGRGLNALDRRAGTVRRYRHNSQNPNSISSDTVSAVLEDHLGDIWIGTSSGLNRLNRASGDFELFVHDFQDPTSLMDDEIFTLYEDRIGDLWIGTASGLNRFRRETGQFEAFRNSPEDPNSLARGGVRDILEDQYGVLWIGTEDGLNRYVPLTDRFIRYQNDPENPFSLSHNAVLSIFEDGNGTIWVGTYGGGLNKLGADRKSFTHYREKDGLPNDVVFGVLGDRQGCLWLSTNHGLSKFNVMFKTFVNYDQGDGLQSNVFSFGAYFKSSSGELFFGGSNGFNSFFPENIVDNPYTPPVVITAFQPGGQTGSNPFAVNGPLSVELDWTENFFDFEMAALSFVQSDENQYAYRLAGYEEDWNYTGGRRTGRYSNLPAGSYTLQVKAANNDGYWEETPVSVPIVIHPPFWATWWFRGLGAFILAGVLVGGYRIRVRNVEHRNLELAKLVEDRTFEVERRREVAEGLREILVILNSDRSVEESLDFIVNQSARLTGAQGALIFKNQSQDPFHLIAVTGGGLEGRLRARPWSPGAADWIMESISRGRPLMLPELTPQQVKDLDLALICPEACGALLGFPLSISGQQYGAMLLFFSRNQTFSDEDLELGFTFADQAALAIANAQLRARAEKMAVETERNRLARDLHDSVTQSLFSTSLIAEALPNVWQSDRVEGRPLLQEVRRLSRGALAEMRSLLLELRPAVLMEARLEDLLNQLVEAVVGQKNIIVETDLEEEIHLPPRVRVAFYRVAQEAMNNVIKHARAQVVQVRLFRVSPGGELGLESFGLEIGDDGIGFDPAGVPRDRMGLEIMRERVNAIGGALEIDSQLNRGTVIRVLWNGEQR